MILCNSLQDQRLDVLIYASICVFVFISLLHFIYHILRCMCLLTYLLIIVNLSKIHRQQVGL